MTDEIQTETSIEPPVPPAVPDPSPEKPPPGLFDTLFGVLFSPSETFGRMRGARWGHVIVPVIALGILAAIASLTFMKRVDMEQFVRDQLRHNRFASKMTDAQMEEAIRQGKEANPYTRSALTIPFSAAFLFLVGLLYWVCFLAMGAEVNYLKSMLVVGWAQIPYWITSLLATGIFLFKDCNELDPQNPVLSNVGAFVGKENISGWLYSILSSIDLFAIWVAILYILGFSALGRTSKGKAAAIVLTIFVLKVVLKAAFSAVFTV
jgi:hypothetical protein